MADAGRGMALACLLLIPITALAQDYQPGHQALQLWNAEARANAPLAVRLWLMIMLASFALGLLFVRRRREARFVVGGILASIAASIILQRGFGVLPLSGMVALMHVIFWSPALYLLLTRRPFLADRSLYARWSGAMTLVILISFIFDIRDSVIYLDHVSRL